MVEYLGEGTVAVLGAGMIGKMAWEWLKQGHTNGTHVPAEDCKRIHADLDARDHKDHGRIHDRVDDVKDEIGKVSNAISNLDGKLEVWMQHFGRG